MTRASLAQVEAEPSPLWARWPKHALVAAAMIWVPALVLLWFYKIGSTDEGAYHYQAFYLALGYMPVLDFFTTNTIWAYLPYAAVIKALSPGLESARIFSVASIIATVVMVTALARKRHGWEVAAYAFVMMAFSWEWLDHNIQVRHSAPANLGLVTAFFVVSYFRSRTLLRIFLAGIAIAITVNSRIILLPLAVFFPFLVYYFQRTASAKVTLPKYLAVYVLGGLIPSVPSLYILATDYQAFFFDYLLARVAWSSGQMETRTAWEWVAWIAETRAKPITDFFFGSAPFASAITMLPVLTSIVALLSRRQSIPLAWLRALLHQPPLMATAAMIVGIYICYCFADRFPGVYLHHWIPFLILLSLGFYARASEILPARSFHWLIRIPLLVGLVIIMADFSGRAAVSVVLRGDPFYKRPLEISQAACWIDQNLAKDAVVMSYFAAPVAVSGRRLPKGYEQGVGILGFFWMQPIPETLANRYKIMTLGQYQAMLETGEIQAVIDEGLASRKLPRAEAERIQSLIDEHYYPVERTSESGPYQILAHKSLNPATLTPYFSTPWFREGKEGHARRLFEQGDYGSMALDVLGDVTTSLAMLPADVASSFHRLIGADHEARCGLIRARTVAPGGRPVR